MEEYRWPIRNTTPSEGLGVKVGLGEEGSFAAVDFDDGVAA
jgi:hypothetical protein